MLLLVGSLIYHKVMNEMEQTNIISPGFQLFNFPPGDPL